MKITRSLKQQLSFVAFRVMTGELNDLGTMAELLDAIAAEARRQNESAI